ncbi:ATP-binding protein [Thermodesulfobacteriota bacterium]
MSTELQKQQAQEKKRRRRERALIIVVILMVVAFTSLLLYVTGLKGEALLPQNILVFLLINVNAILLLLLVFLVVRNIVKLFFERRKGILGSRLRTKLVIAFVGLSLIPTLLLFWVSIGFITNTIENWFSFKVESSLQEALSVTEVYYKNSQDNALYYAKQISQQITSKKLLNQENLDVLKQFVKEKQVEYNLGVVEVFSSQLEELLKVMNPQIPDSGFVSAESGLVQQAMNGNEVTRTQPTGDGDIIRGVVPIRSTWKRKDVVGVVVVNYYISKSLVSKMDTIYRAFQEYKELKVYKKEIKLIYVILLSVVTLLIIFSATWFGFHLSKVISVPISSLANATQQVAQGNLNFQIAPATDDEIGSLVDSFNKMTRDLQVSNEQVALTTSDLRDTIRELDHRRIYMETLLENVAAGVMSINKDTIITAFNKSAEKMLNIKMDDALNHPYATVFEREPLQQLGSFIDEITQFKLRAVERQLTLAFEHKTSFFYIRSNMLFGNDGSYMGLVIVVEDLTQIQQAQRAYAWREVARRIAHEVKNPLTPIKLSAQRLRKKFQPQITSDGKIFDECTRTIVSQVDELKTLVNEFSSFAKLPATNPVPNDVHEIIAETLLLYKEAHKAINFKTVFESDMPRISFDRDQMKRVMINLLDNAVDSMENAGAITIATAYNKPLELVTIEIADTGPGVPPDLKGKLFDPYFSTKKGGTGLGLAIVSTIISDHSGYIRVRDNQPKGTCFVIELPVSQKLSTMKGTA